MKRNVDSLAKVKPGKAHKILKKRVINLGEIEIALSMKYQN